jgi:hypothetical protein
MATEPITVFSRKVDVPGIASLLRSLKGSIEGPDDAWRKATVVTGSLWNKRKLTFSHDPAYYAGSNWVVQLNGMQGYFSQFPDVPAKQRVLDLIPTFRFALGTIHEPDFVAQDERLEVISRVAQHLDAVLFMPSSLRDVYGRILLGARGENDPLASWPQAGT